MSADRIPRRSATAAVARRLRRALPVQAPQLGLGAALRVTPIPNWGGFVNRSFRISEGAVRCHVKLADDPAILYGLRRWKALHRRLEERYHAPRLRGWVELADEGLAGPVFDWVEGRSPGTVRGGLLDEVVQVVSALHADEELGVLLRDEDSGRSCAQVYRDTFHDRFTEDLAGVRAVPPPFVDQDLLAWMAAQAAALERRVTASAAFAEPAEVPVHADLWVDNLLVSNDGSWFLLDWDELMLGDAVADWAQLLGPSREELHPATQRPESAALELTAAGTERLALYARATLLDWVIDSLADWVEAEHGDAQGRSVRTEKEAVHREALACYRSRYG